LLGLVLALLGTGGPLAPGRAVELKPEPVPVATPLRFVADEVAVLGEHAAQGVIGKPVSSSTGENMGQIVNVIVDRDGRPRAAVIDFGGFLGVGSRKIAVDWDALSFAPAGNPDKVTLGLTRDELKSAPEFETGKPVVVIGASGKTQPVPANELQ
jgi:hypothetical protein